MYYTHIQYNFQLVLVLFNMKKNDRPQKLAIRTDYVI